MVFSPQPRWDGRLRRAAHTAGGGVTGMAVAIDSSAGGVMWGAAPALLE
ncbi:MAG TPA: hypothetical protein VJ752_22550 [Burkholderiaceae bacterium]|nr:hypothetical protein [Burkholderiaceae bacterium]